MVFKLPGLLKSPAFQAGTFKAINTRFDQARENIDKYRDAAQKSGANLFKEHEATKNKLSVENKAKTYIASQFSPIMADYLDSTGAIDFAVGMDTKDFFEQVDAEAAKVQQGGGVPEDFKANENMYYGDQRYEQYETSYNKVKDFMDKNNAIFGNSFSLLMEEQAPSLMTKEQFGVTAREDIASLNRTGTGATEIDSVVEGRIPKLVNLEYAPVTGNLKPDGQGGFYYEITDATDILGSGVANSFASQHYRFNPDKGDTGIGFSVRQGVKVTKAIMSLAGTDDNAQSALNDIANIDSYILNSIAGIGSNEAELTNAYQRGFGLYLFVLGERTKNVGLVNEVRQQIQDSYGIVIPPLTGV